MDDGAAMVFEGPTLKPSVRCFRTQTEQETTMDPAGDTRVPGAHGFGKGPRSFCEPG